ncbi:hypothetical protein BH24DEI2_BH24DEI2_17110 [soil metagenome]
MLNYSQVGRLHSVGTGAVSSEVGVPSVCEESLERQSEREFFTTLRYVQKDEIEPTLADALEPLIPTVFTNLRCYTPV